MHLGRKAPTVRPIVFKILLISLHGTGNYLFINYYFIDPNTESTKYDSSKLSTQHDKRGNRETHLQACQLPSAIFAQTSRRTRRGLQPRRKKNGVPINVYTHIQCDLIHVYGDIKPIVTI